MKDMAASLRLNQRAGDIAGGDNSIVGVRGHAQAGDLLDDARVWPRCVSDEDNRPAGLTIPDQRAPCRRIGRHTIVQHPPNVAQPNRVLLGDITHAVEDGDICHRATTQKLSSESQSALPAWDGVGLPHARKFRHGAFGANERSGRPGATCPIGRGGSTRRRDVRAQRLGLRKQRPLPQHQAERARDPHVFFATDRGQNGLDSALA